MAELVHWKRKREDFQEAKNTISSMPIDAFTPIQSLTKHLIDLFRILFTLERDEIYFTSISQGLSHGRQLRIKIPLNTVEERTSSTDPYSLRMIQRALESARPLLISEQKLLTDTTRYQIYVIAFIKLTKSTMVWSRNAFIHEKSFLSVFQVHLDDNLLKFLSFRFRNKFIE